MMPGQNRVTIIEMLDNICLDEFGPQRALLIQRLTEKGVKIITGAKCVEILEDGVKYLKGGKEETLRGFNCIVCALGAVSNNQLGTALKGASFPVHVIGDAKEPRKSKEAIAEGWEIGRSL
jgi:NADH dehydrogenase FAD-containing subunit